MRLRGFRNASLIVSLCFVIELGGIAHTWAQKDAARGTESLRGYSTAESKAEREWEEKMRAIPDPKNLRENMRILSSAPHHVGSVKDKENAEFILRKFREYGLKAEIEQFYVLFPTPRERLVELVEPEKYTALLKEPAVVEDPDSTNSGQLPTYNAYSADGDVRAQVIYVNYGTPKDYEDLAKLGIDVKGKIVLARYGESWRGIKPKVAYEHGAVGCLIYSDPHDDGYFKGDIYPEGAYRPWHGVQRGSVADMPIYPGDPETPGWGSVKGAKRLPLEEAKTLMKIPVLPISYGDALPILKSIRGPVAPEAWRGALPITYHIGPGPAVVHLKAAFNWNIEPIYDVIARIEGSDFPDQWIVRGNHHDAWVNGASDPISGLVAELEEARALGMLMQQGWRPKRTIIFAAWDGEEPGLLGSTEWAEAHAEELNTKAAAYLNTDTNGKGWLGVSGSHTLERFMNEVMRDVRDPQSGKSIWEALQDRRQEKAKTEEEKKELKERADLRIGALGSGSDYTVFIDHLGVASLNLGFGGEGDGGVYHSIYDSFAWYTRFSDTTFEYGRALAQTVGSSVMRMANASALPFEFEDLADTVTKYVTELEKLSQEAKPPESIELSSLKEAAANLKQAAERYQATFRKRSSEGDGVMSAAQRTALNQILLLIERHMVNKEGLPGRPWFKHEIYAPGLYTGYGVKTLPGVREAIEQEHWSEVKPQMEKIRAALLDVATQIDAATRIIESR